MRLLVVDPHRSERDNTLRLLPSEAHEVKVAKDAAEALTTLETREFDVILVESTMTGTSGTELVRRIRARELNTHVYVVMTASRPLPGDLKCAFLAGADDFIRKPIVRDEFFARIEGPTRVRRWASKVFNRASADFAVESELTAISAWTSVDSTVCTELSEMLGIQLSPTPTNDALDGAVMVATLPLTLPAEQTEVCLAVGVDRETSAALAEAMFGTRNVEASAVTDMMREIANVAAGAFKRMAAAEGRAFTTGLPSEVAPQDFRQSSATARRQWLGTVEGSPIALRFELELRVREPKRVRVASLREGMVLAVDLRNPLGALLMRSGTRITESHLGGLSRSFGAEMCIDIVEAA